MSELVDWFQEYSEWRAGVISALARYRDWIAGAGLSDEESAGQIDAALDLLRQDRMKVAFVAEYSRGKSELINAIFFAGYGQRILPCSAGRTTMCPTELLHDAMRPPSIRLLPIDAGYGASLDVGSQPGSLPGLQPGLQPGPAAAFRPVPEHGWITVALDTSSAEAMERAFQQLTQTRRVPVAEALRHGLYREGAAAQENAVDANGSVEISRWRHAIVNFPHPLLRQGLVIIDTPGLNALGTEPELTLNLIPDADAVLFMLAADTGVTRSDNDTWRNQVGAGPGRMVVLNKIDSMWDPLRPPAHCEQQVARQLHDAAAMLGVPAHDIFAVSAQKGLLAKISRDRALLARSRLPALEQALFTRLIPARRNSMRARLGARIGGVLAARQALLQSRRRSLVEQLLELRSLRGKNRNVLEHMMKRIDIERHEFENSLLELKAARKACAELSAQVADSLGLAMLERHAGIARQSLETSLFSVGPRNAVGRFFSSVNAALAESMRKTDEIGIMMAAMYRKFSGEHGLALHPPTPFSLQGCRDALDRIESACERSFGAGATTARSRQALVQRFFETVAGRVGRHISLASRDACDWLKTTRAPLEAQISERRRQLKYRRESIARILRANGELERNIVVLERLQGGLDSQHKTLVELEHGIRRAIDDEMPWLRAAA